ncbi:zinc finger protein 93-like isoform X8 [Achroia grisella]|uniref:zinc finger protein 93-like isoform X8 n=1 Tax=Achroia grisella TaxID=688607 RepID=UPI0027D246F4|nr:zinc finger protein 93-like isoform X8 [Achroia grisella]
MDTTMNHGMCRCCASEGTFKNLSNAYQWMGQEEIYSDMLKECFDISLTTAEPGEEGGICEVCITQLRNAANFKKQVQHTEVQFKKCLQDKLFKSDLIKVEATNLDDGDDSDNDNNLSDNFSGNEFDMAIKKEKEDPKPKKRVATRASTSRAKKSKVDDGEPSTKRIATGTSILTNGADRNVSVDPKVISKRRIYSDFYKNKQNILNVLLNSNANPIRSKDSYGYGCGFCLKKFPEPKTLKMHYHEEHNDDKLIKHTSHTFFESVVKLDITFLKCTLCDTDLKKLDELITHLNVEHKITMYTDVNSTIVPFKFDSDELRCALCEISYSSFKRMQEHMNSHFGYYVCEVCGAGFVTKRLLKKHEKRHENGEYKCEQCIKIFTSKLKRQEHLKRAHLGLDKRNICQYCPERFVDYWKKVHHMVKVHGQSPVVIKCKACDRTFDNQRSLSRHTRKDHLLERKHPCQECHMTFFSKSGLQKHMAKHTGLRQFKCEVCHKAYGRKNTLRQHMRIHANDRRFACTYCGQAFVQKCSWKSHMLSKHGEDVSNSGLV